MVNTFIVKLFPELKFATTVAEIFAGGVILSENNGKLFVLPE